jgi:acetate kinase
MKTILALNSGSSSVKFALYEPQPSGPVLLFRGLLDLHATVGQFAIKDAAGTPVRDDGSPTPDAKADLATSLLDRVDQLLDDHDLVAIGHRIVHGGSDYVAPVRIDAEIIRDLERLTPLAPLHQPACLDPIRSVLASRPDLRQVACFDTAFHHELSPTYRRFALPLEYEARGIRRYGFHGLSFEYIARRCNQPDRRMVVAHLGSGCSLCAIRNGKSVNTTMSLTPLDGLMMATRSGSIDPGVLLYLQQSERMSAAEIEDLLYHKSGLLGVSGLSADMRTLLASGDAAAKAAIDQFCARVAEQIAVMATAMNGMDVLIFTGGIGEHSPEIRDNICARLEWLGVSKRGENASVGDDIEVRAIPTDEEFVIALHTIGLMN